VRRCRGWGAHPFAFEGTRFGICCRLHGLCVSGCPYTVFGCHGGVLTIVAHGGHQPLLFVLLWGYHGRDRRVYTVGTKVGTEVGTENSSPRLELSLVHGRMKGIRPGKRDPA
jgi:hypothetical protein